MSYYSPTTGISILTGGVGSPTPSSIVGSGITSSLPSAAIIPSPTEQAPTIDTTGAFQPTVIPTNLFSSPVNVLSSNPKQSQVYSSQTGLISKGVDYISGISVYTGSGIKAILEFPNQLGTSSDIKLTKQLVELTTISVSVHRVKTPAVAMGYINPKGWGRSRRTVGGTMIFSKFTKDVLADFLTSKAFTSDLSKDTDFSKVDQLPAFNLTLLFEDEYGNASYQRLLGVELITSGDVYSIQEMLSEQTISFVCSDFTPLLPIPQNSSSGVPPNSVTNKQKTPGDVINTSGKGKLLLA